MQNEVQNQLDKIEEVDFSNKFNAWFYTVKAILLIAKAVAVLADRTEGVN